MHGTNLTADGKSLLATNWSAPCPAKMRHGGRVSPEVLLASTQYDRGVGGVTADLAHPLVLDVVQRDGVGDLVAEEEDTGLVVGQRAHGVVRGRTCNITKHTLLLVNASTNVGSCRSNAT